MPEVSRKVHEKSGRYSFCCHVFDPFEEPEEVAGTAPWDGFTDTYRDLKNGLAAFDDGSEYAAVWQWKFDFGNHWISISRMPYERCTT